MQIIGNYIHHNSQIGIDSNNISTSTGKNIVVDFNEIAYNDYRRDFDPGWEAGGTKFWATSNLKVTNNYVHDNIGAGLWSDTDNINTTNVYVHEDTVDLSSAIYQASQSGVHPPRERRG